MLKRKKRAEELRERQEASKLTHAFAKRMYEFAMIRVNASCFHCVLNMSAYSRNQSCQDSGQPRAASRKPATALAGDTVRRASSPAPR